MAKTVRNRGVDLRSMDTAAMEVWPGPMEGVGREDFVRAASSLRLVDRWMTPFFRLSETLPPDRKLRRFAQEYFASGLPVTLQLMGDDPELLGRAGARLLELTPAVSIDLNLGCPSSRVIRNGAGGGLLKTPEKVADFCAATGASIPAAKLSVKLRSGFSSARDMEIFLPKLAASGAVSKIFLHYRTVEEAYSAAPLAERAGRLAEAVKLAVPLPVIANGDIRTPEEAAELVAVTGCAGVMIARPWMRDPFLLRRFKTGDCPDPETGREMFFAELLRQGASGGHQIELAKMLWGADSPRFREAIRDLG